MQGYKCIPDSRFAAFLMHIVLRASTAIFLQHLHALRPGRLISLFSRSVESPSITELVEVSMFYQIALSVREIGGK